MFRQCAEKEEEGREGEEEEGDQEGRDNTIGTKKKATETTKKVTKGNKSEDRHEQRKEKRRGEERAYQGSCRTIKTVEKKQEETPKKEPDPIRLFE
jgi:hypothetical protein